MDSTSLCVHFSKIQLFTPTESIICKEKTTLWLCDPAVYQAEYIKVDTGCSQAECDCKISIKETPGTCDYRVISSVHSNGPTVSLFVCFLPHQSRAGQAAREEDRAWAEGRRGGPLPRLLHQRTHQLPQEELCLSRPENNFHFTPHHYPSNQLMSCMDRTTRRGSWSLPRSRAETLCMFVFSLWISWLSPALSFLCFVGEGEKAFCTRVLWKAGWSVLSLSF